MYAGTYAYIILAQNHCHAPALATLLLRSCTRSQEGINNVFELDPAGFQCLKRSLFCTSLQISTHIHYTVRVCQQRRRLNGQQVPTNEGQQIHHERTTACPDWNRNRHQSDGRQWWTNNQQQGNLWTTKSFRPVFFF